MLGHLQVAAGEWAAGIETLEGIRRRIGNRDAAVLTDLSLGYAGDGDAGALAYFFREMCLQCRDEDPFRIFPGP